MQVGVTFPQSEIGPDPEVIRDYALAAEDLRYEHLLAYDHVLGADPTNREGWRGYTHETMFHEPLTLFSYLAAVTRHLEFVSGVIVLPQRQSALVAKQAAEVDVLSDGRLRLGVGMGKPRRPLVGERGKHATANLCPPRGGGVDTGVRGRLVWVVGVW